MACYCTGFLKKAGIERVYGDELVKKWFIGSFLKRAYFAWKFEIGRICMGKTSHALVPFLTILGNL